MSKQVSKGYTFSDTAPNNVADALPLNNLADLATLTNGAVIDQPNVSTRAGNPLPLAADFILLGDSTQPDTGVPLAVRLDGLLLESQRNGTQQFQGTDTGAANAYVVALTPAATAYTAGMVVRFKAANSNTGASTVNVSGLGVKTIYTRTGANVAANDIVAGQVVELVCDGTYFQMTAAISAGEVTATHATQNLAMGQNQYAAGAGAANVQTVTLTPAPTAYVAGMTVKFVAAYTNTGAVTLNVNGLGAKSFKKIVAGGAVDLLANDIQVGDLVTGTYDGTYYQITSKVRSWDFVSTPQPIGSTVISVAHGLAAQPTKVRAVMVCTTINQSYAVGDTIECSQSGAFQVFSNAINVALAMSSTTPSIVPKTGGASGAITAADWSVYLYASL